MTEVPFLTLKKSWQVSLIDGCMVREGKTELAGVELCFRVTKFAGTESSAAMCFRT
jgi:hypothetical protein